MRGSRRACQVPQDTGFDLQRTELCERGKGTGRPESTSQIPACGSAAPGFSEDAHVGRKETKTPAIGVVFDYQVFESIPMEPHDRRLDKVVTEGRVIYHSER